jgi:hemerythrin-like metal-binding protein
MNDTNLSQEIDVVMIYQDYDTVELAIQQIMELELKFKAYKYESNNIKKILELNPKVLLLSSNNLKRTIKLYIDYLEGYEKKIAPHSTILLINNRETFSAYSVCESDLFDDYVIINSAKEPYRLKLSLSKQLKIFKEQQNHILEELISNSEKQLTSCIEHCETINTNTSAKIQNILNELQLNNNLIKEDINYKRILKNKNTLNDITEQPTEKNVINKEPVYKILIAEPSNLFGRVIEEMFLETNFEYVLVNDGEEALLYIEKFKPDVALIAYDLPTLNGIELTKNIRNKGNNLPIIAYTHSRDKNIINNWIPLGLNDYILKPSTKNIILNNVINAIKKPIEVIPHNNNSINSEIKWIEEFSVGNENMDNQHKVLFSIINDFFREEGEESSIKIFNNLRSYMESHFEAEEKLMKEINYNDIIEHTKQHDEIRKQFFILSKKLEKYNIDIYHKIAFFLYKWLSNHILRSDMEYKSYALLKK